jgi:hypothetical protein
MEVYNRVDENSPTSSRSTNSTGSKQIAISHSRGEIVVVPYFGYAGKGSTGAPGKSGRVLTMAISGGHGTQGTAQTAIVAKKFLWVVFFGTRINYRSEFRLSGYVIASHGSLA